MGRKPIQIEKIDNRVSRNTTFTKRRQGLFGKAAQLCALSGTQLAVIVFSSAGTLFSMGHPSVDALVGNYVNGTTPNPVEPNYVRQIEELQGRIDELKRQVKEEKERKKQSSRTGKERGHWWGKIKLEEFKVKEELQCLQKSLMKLRENVAHKINELGQCTAMPTTVSATDFAEPLPLAMLPPVTGDSTDHDEPLSPRSKVDIPSSPLILPFLAGADCDCEEPWLLRDKIDIPAQDDSFCYVNETEDELDAIFKDVIPSPMNAACFSPSKFC